MGQSKGQDKFESRYMTDDGSVRYRDKRVSRFMAGLFGAIALANLVFTVWLGFANATAAKPVPGFALPFVLAGLVAFSAMFALIGLAFAVLRTVVTDTEVIVKYGLWGPRIPLDRITSCKVVDYEWSKFGGFGIRLGKGGTWAYVPGPGPVVELRYDEGGKDKRIEIGAKDAPALAAQIQRARGARGGVRIDASNDAEALAEAEAEAVQELLEAEQSEQVQARR
ncbi:MAG: hypothetical protein JRI23_29815 [Deltaproteobacteria bacterium]|nr:hypothetical protein [Deltaproteobacteria bacterium]MBW2536348.1 hypothetical protein [Deltaproteobacteria bacterium]